MDAPSEVAGEKPVLTRHAEERMLERRVTEAACSIVYNHADLIRPSRGCRRMRISRSVARELDLREEYPRRDIEAARESELIASTSGRIVTILRHKADLRFRRMGRRATRQRFWRKRRNER